MIIFNIKKIALYETFRHWKPGLKHQEMNLGLKGCAGLDMGIEESVFAYCQDDVS